MNDDYEEQEPKEEAKKDVVGIPTLKYFESMYGRSCEGNDQKAIGIFKNYEPKEKHRRLQHELQMVKDGRVAENLLDAVVSRKRKMKHQGYENWARKMLIWFVESKK